MVIFVVQPVDSVVTSATSASPPRTIAIIPARFGSTRLPGKPLLDIGGRPMIEHVYRRAREARSVSHVLVATDDVRIADVVRGFGGDVRLTRRDHPTGSDRLAEVAAGLACDIVINVQGDEPLMNPALIDAVCAPLAADPSVGMSTARCPIHDPAELADPHVVKVVVDRNGRALYFSRAPIPFAMDAAEAPGPGRLADRHIGLYAYRRATLLALAAIPPTPLERRERLEQLRAIESGYRVATVDTAAVPAGVDTPGDLDRVRHLMATGGDR